MTLAIFRHGLLRTTSHIAMGNYFMSARRYPRGWDDLQGTHLMQVGKWAN